MSVHSITRNVNEPAGDFYSEFFRGKDDFFPLDKTTRRKVQDRTPTPAALQVIYFHHKLTAGLLTAELLQTDPRKATEGDGQEEKVKRQSILFMRLTILP